MTKDSINCTRITIVTPSYNQGDYIEDTILSVLNQGYPNLEYIIIDGGSTDQTVEIIQKYSHRLSFWVSEKDNGQSHAINKGFERATGSIINWLNSDDQLMPGALHRIAELFQSNPDAMLIHGRIEYFGDTIPYRSKNLSKKDLELRYIAHICMPQPATFYRRELLLEQGYLDESLQFSMDADLFIRAGLHYKLLQVDDVFARFRLHPMSKSVSGFNKNFLIENALIFSKVVTTLGMEKAISELKKLDLFTEQNKLYIKPVKSFDQKKLVFYFLNHRLSTLFFRQDLKNFKRVFWYLLRFHFGKLVIAPKLWMYFLLFPFKNGFVYELYKRMGKVNQIIKS